MQPRWSNKGLALAVEADAFTYITEESRAAARKEKTRGGAAKHE